MSLTYNNEWHLRNDANPPPHPPPPPPGKSNWTTGVGHCDKNKREGEERPFGWKFGGRRGTRAAAFGSIYLTTPATSGREESDKTGSTVCSPAPKVAVNSRDLPLRWRQETNEANFHSNVPSDMSIKRPRGRRMLTDGFFPSLGDNQVKASNTDVGGGGANPSLVSCSRSPQNPKLAGFRRGVVKARLEKEIRLT